MRLVHPFPSFLNGALVLVISLVAGASPLRAAVLAVAMVGLQFCIGAVNDLVDEPSDALSKPWKPIPAGLVSRPVAGTIAVVSGGGGLALAALVDPIVLFMAAAMLAAGLVYDLLLKPTAIAWLAFSVAFPILPLYAWYGAAATLPPRWEFLVPVAAICGPAIQLANGLVDLEGDRSAGLATLAVRLGRRRALLAMGLLLLAIHGLAWATLARDASLDVTLVCATASVLAGVGVALSARPKEDQREFGWAVQAAATGLLGVAWLIAAAA